jgi:hypothetical protein
MKKFVNYAREKQIEELVNFLKENQIEFSNEDIDILIEAAWLDRAKKALKTGALLATLPATMSAAYQDTTPKPYHFQTSGIHANQQHDADMDADERYNAAGGPKFKQTLEDAENFVQNFRHTPQHKMALQKAGLPSNYMPTALRSFVYGDKIGTADEFYQTGLTVVEGEVKKKFGKESSVHLIGSEDSVTGGKIILVQIDGIVVATDKQDAIRRAEIIIRQIAEDKGFSLEGFKSNDKEIEVQNAPRSTMDLAAESTKMPMKFSVVVKLKIS